MYCSPPGSSVHGLLQTRTLEWVAISSSRGSSQRRDWTQVLSASDIGRQTLYRCSTWEALSHLFAAAAKSLQSCPTLCYPIDSSPPSYTLLGFSRQEHWSGLSFPSPMRESEEWKWSLSVVSDSTPWTAAYQAPPSKGFSRPEYWRGLPLPSPTPFYSGCNRGDAGRSCRSATGWYHRGPLPQASSR